MTMRPRRRSPRPSRFPAGSTPAEIQEAGTITIGVKYDVPPFGLNNPQTGEVEGFDVDLGNYIADRLGVEAEFREATSDNRIPLLVDGTIDLILSTMTITEERDLEIDFSEPYYVANGDVLVPGDSDIQSLDDLNGRKVCTALGSTYADTIRKEAPDADLRLVDLYSECFDQVQTGAVDAVSTDNVILTGMKIQDDSLELLGLDYTTEPYGVGIPDGDTEMKAVRRRVGRRVHLERGLAGDLRRVGRPVPPRGPAAGPARDHAGGGAEAVPAARSKELT